MFDLHPTLGFTVVLTLSDNPMITHQAQIICMTVKILSLRLTHQRIRENQRENIIFQTSLSSILKPKHRYLAQIPF